MPKTNPQPAPPAIESSAPDPREETSSHLGSEETSTRQMPSDNLPGLVVQLRRELKRLESVEKDSAEESEALGWVLAYLQKSQAVTWQRVVEGNLSAPNEALKELDALRPFAAFYSPELSSVARCSVAIHEMVRSLQTAERALSGARTVARLRDPELSVIEQEILRVLSRNQYQLRRGQVYEQLPEENRPTVARVGQLLVGLCHEGLLHHTEAVAQGNPNTAFYGLTLKGREIFQQLDQQVEAARGAGKVYWDGEAVAKGEDMLFDCLQTIADEKTPPDQQRIAGGCLASWLVGLNERTAAQIVHQLVPVAEKRQVKQILSIARETWLVLSERSKGAEGDERVQKVLDLLLATVNSLLADKRNIASIKDRQKIREHAPSLSHRKSSQIADTKG